MNSMTRTICVAAFLGGLVACSSTPTWDDIPEQDVAGWKQIGVDAASAEAWSDSGFTPEEAGQWRASGFQRASAIDWKDEGFTAQEAAAWKANGFDLKEAVKNRSKGLSPSG